MVAGKLKAANRGPPGIALVEIPASLGNCPSRRKCPSDLHNLERPHRSHGGAKAGLGLDVLEKQTGSHFRQRPSQTESATLDCRFLARPKPVERLNALRLGGPPQFQLLRRRKTFFPHPGHFRNRHHAFQIDSHLRAPADRAKEAISGMGYVKMQTALPQKRLPSRSVLKNEIGRGPAQCAAQKDSQNRPPGDVAPLIPFKTEPPGPLLLVGGKNSPTLRSAASGQVLVK